MTHHSETHPACCWLAGLIERAYPESAGMTLAAFEALAEQETFTGRQLAYVAQVMFNAGAQARTDGDRAELIASRAANFVPRPTREARVAARTAAMAVQHEIAWLRRYGHEPAAWAGGTAEQASEQFSWDADRPDLPDLGPSAANWHEGVGVPTRRTRAGLVWRDEARRAAGTSEGNRHE